MEKLIILRILRLIILRFWFVISNNEWLNKNDCIKLIFTLLLLYPVWWSEICVISDCSKIIYHSGTLLWALWKELSWHLLSIKTSSETFWRGDFRSIRVGIPEMVLIILHIVFAFVGSWFSITGSSSNSIHLRSCWNKKACLWKWQKLQI